VIPVESFDLHMPLEIFREGYQNKEKSEDLPGGFCFNIPEVNGILRLHLLISYKLKLISYEKSMLLPQCSFATNVLW